MSDWMKLPCGCYVEHGAHVGGVRIMATAFLCDEGHEQDQLVAETSNASLCTEGDNCADSGCPVHGDDPSVLVTEAEMEAE